jgi:hydrogenase maturation protease
VTVVRRHREAWGVRVLVAGIGNLFHRDDAFGTEVVRRLAGQEVPAGVRVVDYGVRGMHLAYDLLDAWDALVLVDALPNRGRPGALTVLEVGPDDLGEARLDAHGMDLGSVLSSLRLLGGRLPRTLIVGCQVRDVDEGMGLSAPVAGAVAAAVNTVRILVDSLVVHSESR